MIALRVAESDADLEAWIEVRRLVLPNESGGTVELLRAQERPERLRRQGVGAALLHADFALDGLASISLESWLREEATLPAGSFVALEGGQVVGYSGLLRHDDEGVVEDGLTVVRRNRRRRGLALALKRMELAWAAAGGYREVVTWTQQGNHAMRRLNELLGYEHRDVSVTMPAPLPLP